MALLRWVLAFLALWSTVADAKPRGAPGPPQIFYNIITDGGAACNGDVATVTRTTSITSGTKALSVTANTFASGDVGKGIALPGAGAGGGTQYNSIAAFTDAQHVTLTNNAQTTISAVSTTFSYGTDDADNFMAFNTWARANQGVSNQVILTVPNGSNCWFGSDQAAIVGIRNAWAAGINNLIVEGTGATLNTEGGFGFQLGGAGICAAGIASGSGCTARIESVSAGAAQVTLTAASLASGYVSRFSAGRWLMVGGLNTQALWNSPFGYPPNLTYYEWRQITNVNAGTGVITLDRALTNSYLSTWPLYNEGNAFESDPGGPATIYAVGDTWNATGEYRGLTINQTGQTYAQMRNITYRNVTFNGGFGGIPTQNESWSAINSSWPNATMEVDKLIGTMTMDGVTIRQVQFQSNSTDLFVLRNSNVTLSLQGGGKRTDITDTTLAGFIPGSYIYGNTPGPLTCTRCNVASFANGGVGYNDTAGVMSMSSGVISFPNTAATGSSPAQQWASTIGKTIWFSTNGASGQYSSLGQFSVLGVTQDATNVYVQTDRAGGFPTITAYSGTENRFRANGAQQFTCTDPNAASDPTFIAMCTNAGAPPLVPMMSYSKRSYAPSAGGQAGTVLGVGKLVSLTIDVTTAYTGSGSLVLNPAQFTANMVKQSDWSVFNWFYSVNLKQAGARVITPSGVTCNGSPGACSGDTNLTVPEAVWLYGGVGAWVAGTPSGGTNPQFSITLRTDQSP